MREPGLYPMPPRRAPRKPRRWKPGFLLLILAAVLSASLYLLRQLSVPELLLVPTAGEIRVSVARSGTLEKTLRLSGVTTAENSVALLAPRLLGRRGRGERFNLLLSKLVSEGEHVKRGQIVAEFDREYMRNRLDDYQSLVVRQQMQVQKLAANLKIARYAHEQRVRRAQGSAGKAALDLKTVPVRSAILAERFRLAYEEARAYYEQLQKRTPYVDISEGSALRRAELDLKEQELEVRRARENLDKMVVRSPMDGIAVLLRIYRGGKLQHIQAGDRLGSGQPYMQIVDVNSVGVLAYLNQVDSARIRVGAPVTFRFEALPGLVLPGHVYSVGTIARGRKRGTGYLTGIPVRLKLDRTDPRLLPHYSVSADVVLGQEDNAVIVPRGAVFSSEVDGAPVAFVRRASGWEERKLRLGLANNIEVAVHAGIQAGEVVALERPPVSGEGESPGQ